MNVRVVTKSGEYSFECSDIVVNLEKFLTFNNVKEVPCSVKDKNFKIVDVLFLEVDDEV